MAYSWHVDISVNISGRSKHPRRKLIKLTDFLASTTSSTTEESSEDEPQPKPQ